MENEDAQAPGRRAVFDPDEVLMTAADPAVFGTTILKILRMGGDEFGLPVGGVQAGFALDYPPGAGHPEHCDWHPDFAAWFRNWRTAAGSVDLWPKPTIASRPAISPVRCSCASPPSKRSTAWPASC